MAYTGPDMWAKLDRPPVAKYFDRVSHVWLVGSEFTDERCWPLTDLDQMKTLVLVGTHVSNEWVLAFRKRRPDCVVRVELR